MQAHPPFSDPTGPARDPAHWPLFALLQVLLHLVLPALLGVFLWRGRREPAYRRHLSHRFGLGPVAARGALWIFAASLGEQRAASPLVRALRARGHDVCLTASSPAGLAEARRLFGTDPGVATGYAPLDLFWSIGLFLFRQRPSALLIVESEVWPGKLTLAGLAGIPRIQVNGNLVDRTLDRRILGLPSPIVPFLRAFDLVLTKSEAHRARYLRAGVEPARIALVGELKFDLDRPEAQVAAGRALKRDWAGGRPVFLVASSVTEEEPALLDLVGRLMALPHPPRVIWAPRSPQRFDAVAAGLAAAGHAPARRSAIPDLDALARDGADVLLGDTLGEMNIWYAAADLVFVGASLVDHGGHNIVEPLALGRPVVMGPSTWGIVFPAREAAAAQVLDIAADADDLSDRVTRLLTDAEALSAMGDRAAHFSSDHLGAAARSLALIEARLGR